MAGLQYYFFPTDFFYPRPPPTADRDSANKPPVVHIQTQKRDKEDMEKLNKAKVKYNMQEKNLSQQLSASKATVPSSTLCSTNNIANLWDSSS
ncbi:hypothetical protein JCGZ_22461 [Jatropha curcas]|uniref:Uncharacterized protein n=1 Tax=Jatropha curcas TaxID=180498 RepID=A0A067K1W2_JATCU|nr:hypothetical protein JCGZ_22461 [Jatropha curcas]